MTPPLQTPNSDLYRRAGIRGSLSTSVPILGPEGMWRSADRLAKSRRAHQLPRQTFGSLGLIWSFEEAAARRSAFYRRASSLEERILGRTRKKEPQEEGKTARIVPHEAKAEDVMGSRRVWVEVVHTGN